MLHVDTFVQTSIIQKKMNRRIWIIQIERMWDDVTRRKKNNLDLEHHSLFVFL